MKFEIDYKKKFYINDNNKSITFIYKYRIFKLGLVIFYIDKKICQNILIFLK